MKKRRLKHDVAYGCFLLWALTVIALDVLMGSFTDNELAQGAGAIILVLLPFLFISFIAMLVGIVLSIWLWKHWPLGILTGMSVLLIVEIFTEYGSAEFYNAVPIVYSIGVIVISGVWFLFLRRGPFPPDVKE